MKQPIHLLLVDPQNDFCDLPAGLRQRSGESPSLPVYGAHNDLVRVADLVRQLNDKIDAITLTLDSHQRLDIAHTAFWEFADGSEILPFTTITAADIHQGVYKTKMPQHQARALGYIEDLQSRGRYQLVAWPVHCELGGWGHNVHNDVRLAYNQWEIRKGRSVYKVIKGLNPWTEHYSALIAEVPDPHDPSTQLNHELLQRLEASGTLIVAGEASSHCVKATVEHLIEFGQLSCTRIILLTDAMSPVSGCDALQKNFFEQTSAKGVRLMTCSQVIDELSCK